MSDTVTRIARTATCVALVVISYASEMPFAGLGTPVPPFPGSYSNTMSDTEAMIERGIKSTYPNFDEFAGMSEKISRTLDENQPDSSADGLSGSEIQSTWSSNGPLYQQQHQNNFQGYSSSESTSPGTDAVNGYNTRGQQSPQGLQQPQHNMPSIVDHPQQPRQFPPQQQPPPPMGTASAPASGNMNTGYSSNMPGNGGSSAIGATGAPGTAPSTAAATGMGPTTSSTAASQDDVSPLVDNDELSQVDKDLIFEGLKQLYKKKVLPLEIASKYSHFSSPPMGPSDFDAKPMVLILGQYSVGKTSFIRSLLGQDFPGQRVGPEPTTDRFTAIMQTNEEQRHARLLPGHALVMQSSRPFRGLATYGNNFLSKFEGAEVDAPILRNITIVDTPGVLAGEKQRLGRDYDFSEVIKWFADRADMIIIMFDAHKLDISDELKSVLDTLKPHQEKIRVLLNKADTIDTQALLRVYGALMWALGKVVGTPEVCKVYLGSFWDAPLRLQDNRAILEKEKNDLLQEMMTLPANAVVRRINELVKRARSVKVHAYIIHYLKKQMPYLVGKSEKQKRLLGRLENEFLACARRYNLPLGDFPNVEQYRRMLSEVKDISDFKKLDKSMVADMDKVLTHDIPLLLQKATSRKSDGSLIGSTGAAAAAAVSSGVKSAAGGFFDRIANVMGQAAADVNASVDNDDEEEGEGDAVAYPTYEEYPEYSEYQPPQHPPPHPQQYPRQYPQQYPHQQYPQQQYPPPYPPQQPPQPPPHYPQQPPPPPHGYGGSAGR